MLVFLGAQTPLLAQTKYVVTDLGTLGGAQTSTTGINNAGQVVGNSSLTTGETRGYRTSPNKPINPATDAIATLGGTYSLVSGINSSGQASGYSPNAVGGSNRAMRVDVDGSVHDLGTLGGTFPNSLANAINDLGQLTGSSSAPPQPFGPPCFGTGGSMAFRTASNSAMVATDGLNTLLGLCRYSVGFGINSAGQVAGYSAAVSVLDPEIHAMVASPGGAMVDLGLLGGIPTFPTASGKHAQANAINDLGQIVGSSSYDNAAFYYATHAFLTTTGGGAMTDLGTLGGSFSAANAINMAGQIVGNSSLAGDTSGHAFIYAAGVMSDLNSFIAPSAGWEVVNATGINDNGQISGTAWLGGVQFVNHAVRLDPVDTAISNFITELSDPTLNLTSGQINSLTDKLVNALASLQQGANKQAVNQLSAFINSVQTWQKTNKISARTATTLIDAANTIIAVL